jgi:large subunit ribosomal protein L6
MSRIAKYPVKVPKGVAVNIERQDIAVKGPKGELKYAAHRSVEVAEVDGALQVSVRTNDPLANAHAGTTRALLNNMVNGVTQGFEKKLELVGIGYRAQAQGKTLNLVIGYSHPVNYSIPAGITVQTPSQTEIVVTGIDKQMVGQIAAVIRAFRPPDAYKGKGIRYANEKIVLKEAKKK